MPWLKERVGNPHSVTHQFGRAAHDAVEKARAQVATLINADPNEIVFTSGATEATNIALRGILAGRKAHVLTSTIEHSCVRETLAHLARGGASVSEVEVDADGLVDAESLIAGLTRRTALVTVMAANNEVGTVQPIDEIGSACREAGVVFHTDAAQAAGKIAIDVRRSNIDLLSISGHKIYGPQGIGALYCRGDIVTKITPMTTGGGQERGLRAGTVPTALCVGLGEACAIAHDEMSQDAGRCLRLRTLFLT